MLCNHLCHTSEPLALEAINPEYMTVGGPKIYETAQPDNVKHEEEFKGDFNS